jgi:crotonobetainyl-CoA:carnitine CoA-transferase CaiB-like acyl-CoA transferase
MTGRPGGPADRGNPYVPGLYGIFPTADGWLAVVGVVGAARSQFFELIGRPDLAELFPQPLYWGDDKAALFPLVEDALRRRTTAAWCELLGEAGIRHAPVRDHGEVVADPAVWDNGYLVRADGPDGEVPVVVAPVRFSDNALDIRAIAPELGQHTEEVLLELGYDWDDINQLTAAGAI